MKKGSCMKFANQIIKEFCVTEKATQLASNSNQYTFEVFMDANRIEVAKAISSMFNVTVEKVNILIKKPKFKSNRLRRNSKGKTPFVKRAVVTLAEGDKIELL